MKKMTKKNYLIIGVTALFFIIAIIAILVLGKNNNDWTTDILNSYSYEMTMKDCSGKEKKLDNNVLNTLSDKWNTLSNNGPWTGDASSCYTTLTISYDTDGIIREKKIVLIDNSSIAFLSGGSSVYYTNASDIINYLNAQFIS